MALPDPGGHFDSDDHRRVQAAVPNPDEDPKTLEEVQVRVNEDDYLDLSQDETLEILKDLEASGHSKELKDGWRNTKEGFNLLTGPPEGAYVK